MNRRNELLARLKCSLIERMNLNVHTILFRFFTPLVLQSEDLSLRGNSLSTTERKISVNEVQSNTIGKGEDTKRQEGDSPLRATQRSTPDVPLDGTRTHLELSMRARQDGDGQQTIKSLRGRFTTVQER